MTITGMGQIRLKLCGLFSKVYSRQCSTSTLYCKIYVWLPPAAVNNTQSKPNTRKKEQGRCTVTTIFYQQFSSTPTQHARDRWSKYITPLVSSVLTQLLVPRPPTGCHKLLTTEHVHQEFHSWMTLADAVYFHAPIDTTAVHYVFFYKPQYFVENGVTFHTLLDVTNTLHWVYSQWG